MIPKPGGAIIWIPLIIVIPCVIGQEYEERVPSTVTITCLTNTSATFECDNVNLPIWQRNGTRLPLQMASDEYNITRGHLEHLCEVQYNNSEIQCTDSERRIRNKFRLIVRDHFQLRPRRVICPIDTATTFVCTATHTAIWIRNGIELLTQSSDESYNITDLIQLSHSCRVQYNNSELQCSDRERKLISKRAKLIIQGRLGRVNNIHIMGKKLIWEAPFQLNISDHISYEVQIHDLKNASTQRNKLSLPKLVPNHEYNVTIWPRNTAGRGEPNYYTIRVPAADHQETVYQGFLQLGIVLRVVIFFALIIPCVILCIYFSLQSNGEEINQPVQDQVPRIIRIPNIPSFRRRHIPS